MAKYRYYKCGICAYFHPWEWNGDCRDDPHQRTQEDLDKMHGDHYTVGIKWERDKMDKGDKLYRVFNGKLETATFVKEKINPGAILPTWTVRKADGTVVSASTKPYYAGYELTKLAAWKKYAQELDEEQQNMYDTAQAALEQYYHYCSELIRVRKKIAEILT